MYIRKITEGSGIPSNAVLDGYSNSQTDAYSCNQVNKMLSYFTTETRVGTWIDGKPLYRKVLTGTSSGTSTTVQNGIANIGRIIKIEGTIKVRDNEIKNIPTIELSSNNYISVSAPTNSTLRIDNSNSDYMRGEYVIILEYTKSTD